MNSKKYDNGALWTACSDYNSYEGSPDIRAMVGERECTECDEKVALIPGCCYDCACLCRVCEDSPAHPRDKVCTDCAE